MKILDSWLTNSFIFFTSVDNLLFLFQLTVLFRNNFIQLFKLFVSLAQLFSYLLIFPSQWIIFSHSNPQFLVFCRNLIDFSIAIDPKHIVFLNFLQQPLYLTFHPCAFLDFMLKFLLTIADLDLRNVDFLHQSFDCKVQSIDLLSLDCNLLLILEHFLGNLWKFKSKFVDLFLCELQIGDGEFLLS